jgi:hypothetical protein
MDIMDQMDRGPRMDKNQGCPLQRLGFRGMDKMDRMDRMDRMDPGPPMDKGRPLQPVHGSQRCGSSAALPSMS